MCTRHHQTMILGQLAIVVTRAIAALHKYSPPLKIRDWFLWIALVISTAAYFYVLFGNVRAVTPLWVVFSLAVAFYLSVLSIVVWSLLRDIKIWKKISKQTSQH
jgi:hypothetical protein